MRFEIAHTTRYRYSAPIREAHTEVRLRPSDEMGQRVLRHRLEVRPEATVGAYSDGFGNRVQYFDLLPPHDHLEIVSRAAVETGVQQATHPPDIFPHDLLLFRPPVVQGPALRRIAARLGSFDASAPAEVEAAADRLRELIARSFTYSPASTTVTTATDEVVRLKRGVCQDFAHLVIAVSRMLGLPARYVSGYVYSGSGEPTLGASHAWADILVPEKGWLPFDATHSGLASDRYVRLAVGRDYRDAAPTRGVFVGSARSDMEIKVETRPLGGG